MPQSEPNKNLIIDGNPTKELFVYMLVRDLTLRDAIGDLVDNSVDGAKRLRPDIDVSLSRNRLKPDGQYDGLTIDIQARPEGFSITDNCGGISSELARNYAFRFGRPKDMPKTPGSVGQFGIGMKRALFKLGRAFVVESTSIHSKFVVAEDIDEWIKNEEWSFEFKTLIEDPDNPPTYEENERGTIIRVAPLRDDTIASFKLGKFIDSLRREIEREQLYNVHRGLKIAINNVQLESRQLFLLQSDEFQIAHLEKSFRVKREMSEGNLRVEIYAGISEENTEHGGWYVFCNDRLILGNDQTETTGWGDKIPKYHSQYNRFRGYVFFNSDNADLLPWNTVKNDIDHGNPYFQAIRVDMINLMRPVINFLNWVHDERQKIDKPEDRVLAKALERANLVVLSEVVNLAPSFSSPQPAPVTQRNTRISYSKPKEQVEEAKKFFGVRSNIDVGINTFDYWYDAEVEEL